MQHSLLYEHAVFPFNKIITLDQHNEKLLMGFFKMVYKQQMC